MEKSVGLEAILHWNMTPEQGEAFRVALIYEEEYRRAFQGEMDYANYRKNSIPKKNDPRNSNIFRMCWKMRRETTGLLEYGEYRLYIRANLAIIKMHNGRIEPNIICGDKAWIRWKVWKRRYDRKMADLASTLPPPSVAGTNPKIIIEIDRTKKFLFERCEGVVTFEKIKAFSESILRIWVASGKVCPYYLLLSPFIERTGKRPELLAVCTGSEELYREKLTPELTTYFRHEYAHEFD